MRRHSLIYSLIGSVATLLLASVWLTTPVAAQTHSAEGKTLKNPVPASAESIETGRRRFIRFCGSCHGVKATGDGPMPPEGSKPANLIDDKWDYGASDGEIFVTIRDGVGPKFDMDAWKGKLTDQDIWNVINYIRSLNPKTAAKKP